MSLPQRFLPLTIPCSAAIWPIACPRRIWHAWKRLSETRLELRARLEDVRNNREDFQLHTLGGIWHRSRLTCPSRQQLGSYLLDALDPQLAGYIRFHLDVIECPFCQANFADLERRQSGQPASLAEARGKRFLEATRELLGKERGHGI